MAPTVVTPLSETRAVPSVAPFRLVLPREKQTRLAARLALLGERRPCPIPTCEHDCLAVVLVDSEDDAILCPRHELCDAVGTPIAHRPAFVTAAW